MVKYIAHEQIGYFCYDTEVLVDKRLSHMPYAQAGIVHDNDGTADAHQIPGKGTINWNEFSDALAEIGFDGVLNFETQVPTSIANGEERDRLERELAQIGHRLAKNA